MLTSSFDLPGSTISLQLLLCGACSFLLGMYFGKTIINCPITFCENLSTPENPVSSDPQMPIVSDLTNYGSQAFACNTQRAFETLTTLHTRRIKLDDHRVRGDANLAREGTFARKATAADAAENAFRDCMNVMMPELLNDWDEKSGKKQIQFRKPWDEKKEQKIGGISFKDFEQTAAEMENAILTR